MRIFQFIELPEEHLSALFDLGLGYLKDMKEAIAIKAFSMTVLRKICATYPELVNEVEYQIQILVDEKISAGITSRGQHELKQLAKIKGNYLKRT